MGARNARIRVEFFELVGQLARPVTTRLLNCSQRLGGMELRALATGLAPELGGANLPLQSVLDGRLRAPGILAVLPPCESDGTTSDGDQQRGNPEAEKAAHGRPSGTLAFETRWQAQLTAWGLSA